MDRNKYAFQLAGGLSPRKSGLRVGAWAGRRAYAGPFQKCARIGLDALRPIPTFDW